jgi:hypothetical protein
MPEEELMRPIRLIIFIVASMVFFSSFCHAYDFTYTIGDPSTVQAQQYIEYKNNVELTYEYVNTTAPVYWKPIIGGSSIGTTTPGTVIYHFDFGTDIVETANLYIHMPTFNWSYSQGHNYLYGSTDNVNWVQLLDVPPPVYEGANSGTYNGSLPSSLLGANDIYLKALLYSYGAYASYGGAMTNTAQLTRWSGPGYGDPFKLEVNFQDNGGGTTVPEPMSIFLLIIGVLGVVGIRKKVKK